MWFVAGSIRTETRLSEERRDPSGPPNSRHFKKEDVIPLLGTCSFAHVLRELGDGGHGLHKGYTLFGGREVKRGEAEISRESRDSIIRTDMQRQT